MQATSPWRDAVNLGRLNRTWRIAKHSASEQICKEAKVLEKLEEGLWYLRLTRRLLQAYAICRWGYDACMHGSLELCLCLKHTFCRVPVVRRLACLVCSTLCVTLAVSGSNKALLKKTILVKILCSGTCSLCETVLQTLLVLWAPQATVALNSE